jgi:acetyl esterase/lipase
VLTGMRIRSRVGAWLWFPKVLATSLAPLLALVGGVAAVLGLARRTRLTALLGLAGAAITGRYVAQAAAAHADWPAAFGPDWQERVDPALTAHMPRRPWPWSFRSDGGPRVQRDVVYWTLSDSGRALLCDVWQPGGASPSGLAVVYVHGGAWHLGTKAQNTGTFFSHLAAQGHVVVDVAYRLLPETDGLGMVGDVKRAVAWTKRQAAALGIDPARIVLAGGSAGAHLALVAAYGAANADLTPADLRGEDTSVCGVVSYYGPADLRPLLSLGSTGASGDGTWAGFRDVFGGLGRLDGGRHSAGAWPASELSMALNLLGGQVEERERLAELLSPICLVSPQSPPTLFLHGRYDALVPIEPARLLYRRLREVGVPVAMIEFPQTEHGFDLFLPTWSVATHVATYEVDRFLALLASPPRGAGGGAAASC